MHRFRRFLACSRRPRLATAAALAGALVGVTALVLLVATGDAPDADPPAGRVVRGTGREAARPLEVRTRWDASFDADPTELLVDGPDTFVVGPYSVRVDSRPPTARAVGKPR